MIAPKMPPIAPYTSTDSRTGIIGICASFDLMARLQGANLIAPKIDRAAAAPGDQHQTEDRANEHSGWLSFRDAIDQGGEQAKREQNPGGDIENSHPAIMVLCARVFKAAPGALREATGG